MLPPYELRNKDFSKVMRGYNPVEVDEHFNFVIEKYTELYRENDELERKLKAAYAKLDEIKNEEESIRSAMVNAQRASSKIMTEANSRADIIINTARKSCDRILADFKKKIQEERAVLIALNKAIYEFKEKLFKMYNSHISFVEEIKLLDENDIAKYALSDESFSASVIQNIKQEISEIAKDTEPADQGTTDPSEQAFVEASLVPTDPSERSTNVKDTIKKINKRFSDESDQQFDISDAEKEAEREYDEMLKQLGVLTPVDTEAADEVKLSDSESDGSDFKKAYKTPKNYGDIIKKRSRKK